MVKNRIRLDLFSSTFPNEEAEKGKTNSPPENEKEGEDGNVFQRIAELLGIDTDAPEKLIRELEVNRARSALSDALKEQRAKKDYARLLSEAKGLSESIEGFDLERELSDSRFKALVRSGFSLEDAFSAIHSKELLEKAINEKKEEMMAEALKSLRDNLSRPDENGARSQAPAQSQKSVSNLSGKGIRDILRRVENGAKIKF